MEKAKILEPLREEVRAENCSGFFYIVQSSGVSLWVIKNSFY